MSFDHLKPLSAYSHLVYLKRSKNSSTYNNIKVHISNQKVVGVKRRLEDVCFEDSPLKRPCSTPGSPDDGYFSFNSHRSTPLQNLIITKTVTPPRSKVCKPLVPVESTPLYNHINAARERLPSLIPLLNLEGEVSTHINGSNNGSTIPLIGTEETVKTGVKEVLHSLFEYIESKPKTEVLETVVAVKKEEVSGGNEVSSGKIFESALPLEIQVKTEVEFPETKTFNEKEWEANKRMYVASVNRHMTEQNGVMNELQSLMNTVATVKPGENGQPWQHPSDLTRRNYKLSRVTVPLISLDKWQEQNHRMFRRFAHVTEIHHWSPVP